MKLYTLIGEKLGHSLSPQIHNYMFNSLNINANYSTLQIEKEDFHKTMSTLKSLGYSGINVTIPYKESIIPYLDNISPEAETIGAVNTVAFKDNAAIGYNTDYYGFKIMLEKEDVDAKGKNIVLLGTGGSAKTIICYLKDCGAKSVKVVYRSKNKVIKLKEKFDFITPVYFKDEEQILGDICINTTPVGMYPDINQCFLSENIIKNFTLCIDIIYNPTKTKFLELAGNNNIKSINGVNMLIYQAIKAQEIFQGKPLLDLIKIDSYKIENLLKKV